MPEPPPQLHRSDNHFALVTLGGMCLRLDGVADVLMGPGKPVAMLTYVALAPGRTASRDHLVELLWADADIDKGRHALRQTLWQLRQLLGESAFRGKDEVTLAADIGVDCERFLALITSGDLDAAAASYTGAFLPLFASPGGAAFEQWADLERERLQGAFIQVMDRLIRRELAGGHTRKALALARQLRDTGSEPVGRRFLIEGHLAEADHITAMVEADAFERWAAMNAVALDRTAADIIARAQSRSDRSTAPESRPASSHLVAELVGREAEFARTLGAWADARASRCRHVHLVASPGIGKTRLLMDLEARLTHDGAAVRYVRAHPAEKALPYALAASIAGQISELPGARAISPHVASTLTALDPSLASIYNTEPDTATGDEARRRRALALAELVRAVADEAPLALLIDDLHWSDDESHSIVESLIAHGDRTRVLVVTATRPGPDRHVRSDERITIPLGALTIQQVAHLVDSIASNDAASHLADLPALLHDSTGGVPLHVLEMLQLAQDREVLTIAAGRWRCTDPQALAALLQAGEGIRQRLWRLGPESRTVVHALALVGAPTPVAILAAVLNMEPGDVDDRLRPLESQGFIQRTSGGWEAAHDEIAAEASVMFTDEAVALRQRLTLALEHSGDTSPAALTRLARFHHEAGDRAAVARVVVRHMNAARHRGTRTSAHDALEALLGHAIPAETRRSIISNVPLSWRVRRHLPYAAAAAIVLVGSIGWMVMGQPTAPDSVLEVAWYTADGTLESGLVDLHHDGWNPGAPLDVTMRERPVLDRLESANGSFPIIYSPRGDTAFTALRRSGQSNEDIAMIVGDSLSWLTDDERDDVAPSVHPDGRGVVFVTSRWSPAGDDDFDIATVNLSTRAVRQLTKGPASDVSPMVSPDGTRIAFIRHYQDGRASALCLTSWLASEPTCGPTDGPPHRVIGWTDHGHVLIMAAGDGPAAAATVDIVNWTSIPTIPSGMHMAVMDGGSDFQACICIDASTGLTRLEVAPLGNYEQRRPVVIPGNRTPAKLAVAAWTRPASLERLVIRSGQAIIAGAYHQMRVHGFDRSSAPVIYDTTTARWSTDNGAVATIDSLTGVLFAIAPGAVRVRVTAGGWRTAALAVVVGPSASRVVMAEDWSQGLRSWKAFGVPLATIAPVAELGLALLNNGDGRHLSGAYSTTGLDSREGLTVEVSISSPVDRLKWQRFAFAVSSTADSPVLAEWDHRAGAIPGAQIVEPLTCAVGYPFREGGLGIHQIAVINGYASASHPAPQVMKTGRPYLVRLSLFADGRCGVAVDGTPVAISRNLIPLGDPMRLWITGNSVGTRIGVGRITVWSGDPGGVDWAALNSRPKQ